MVDSKLKIVFMGTPKFAECSLIKLLNRSDKYEVSLVVTQPDKPQGRKKIILPSEVKALSQKNSLKLYQPNNLKSDEVFKTLSDEHPDFIVVVAYGKILPKRVLDLPKFGAINVHGSLLPKYRGAAPIQWGMIRGEKIFGVTTMFMDEGLDTGKIILQRQLKTDTDEDFNEIYLKLADIGSELLIETLELVARKQNFAREIAIMQDDSEATFAPPLSKSDGIIDWSNDAKKIHNLIRGCSVWPVAWTFFNGKILKIYKSRIYEAKNIVVTGKNFGTVLSGRPMLIYCGNNTILEILELQLEGKRRVTADDFSRGNNLEGKILG